MFKPNITLILISSGTIAKFLFLQGKYGPSLSALCTMNSHMLATYQMKNIQIQI